MTTFDLRVLTLVFATVGSVGCTQLSGLDDYHGRSSRADATTGSVTTSDDPDADSEQPRGVGSGDAATSVATNVDASRSRDAAAVDGDVDSALDPEASVIVADDAAVTGDAGTPDAARCEAPNRMCGSSCVAADDARHCGGCDHDCTALAHVSGAVSCVNGQCVVPAAACEPGFAHCSSSADDGCETDIRSPAHCGRCDVACGTAAPLCASGATAANYGCVSDCVAPSPTKCGASCVDTKTSVAHCGGCDQPCPSVTRGTPVCSGGSCDFECNSGYHRCGNQCLSNTAPESCGSSCTPCSAPANATPICSGSGSCDFECNSGFHRCGNQCLSNTAVSSCGGSCTPCTAPANATPTCGGTSCDFQCNSGFHRCGNQCVSNTAVSSCGSSCTPCTAPANATPTCGGTSCDFQCNSGFHRCGNACVPDDSVTQCGSSCQACPQIANGTPVCQAGACTAICDLGGGPVNGACPPPGPPNIVFVSTGKVVGDTGIAAADTMCKNEAASAGLAGTYRALLSTETVAASSRLGTSRGWVRPDGKPFADRIEDFFPSTNDKYRIFYPPRITAAGADIGRVYVLTGTAQNGTPMTGYTCASWTVTAGGSSGFGVSSGAGFVFSSGYSTGCSTQFSVYCFGVGNLSRVLVAPVSGRKAFMSKSAWAPGSGISTADALCQSEANAAGFSGTFLALLATQGASAASRFDTTRAPWVRPDGVPIMPTAAQVFQSNTTMWDVALNTTADLSLQFGNWLVYSGEPTPGAGVNPLTQPGTAASTCDNWTSSAAGSGRGGMGTAGNSTLLDAFADKQWGCNYGGSSHIVCLQQ